MAASIDAWASLHREELVRDIMELVHIPSITGTPECLKAQQRLAEMAHDYGLATEEGDGVTLSVLLPGTQGEQELGLLAHLDVVPEGEGWKYAPYDPVEKDGFIIGRGTADNKGSVITAMFVQRCLRDIGVQLKSTVRLIAGTREETDMSDMTYYLQHHSLPAYTLNCDCAWGGCVGEKGILEAQLVVKVEDGNLLDIGGGIVSNSVAPKAYALLSHADADTLAKARALCKGLSVEETEQGVMLRVQGKAAHASAPSAGDNAIFKLLRVLCGAQLLTGDAQKKVSLLNQCFADDYGTGLRIQHEDSTSGKTTCISGLLRYENGEIRLGINVRSAVTQSGESLMNALKKRLDKLGIGLEKVRWSPSRLDSPEMPEIKILIETCQEFFDPKFSTYVIGGGTYSRVFPRSLPYGPVNPKRKNPFGDAHGVDESVCIEDLLRAIKVYAMALKRLDEYFHK